MPDGDLIAIRMKLMGGPQVERESARATKAIKGTERAVKSNSVASKAAAASSSQAFKQQAAMMQSAGRTMTYGLTVPLAFAGAMAVKTAAGFDRSMAQVRTATGLGGQGMQEMEALALKWGSETIFSANESAEAMLELTKSGITPAQTKAGALGATMNLAATEGLELGKTAEIVGAAMNTFGLRANEAGRISDALAGGALASSASVGGLALSLSQGGQGAAEMGIPLEEAVGTLAAFAQNGIQASDAGTSMKTFLARLNPTTKKSKELMAELGLSFFDSKGHMLSMKEIAGELQHEMGNMTDQERGAAFATIFGSDARRAANIVFKEGEAGLTKYTAAAERNGAAEKMAEAQMTGLAGSLENLKGSLETAAVHLGHALAPAIEATATAVGGMADAFSTLPPEVQTTVAVVGTLAALAGPVLWFAGSMAKAVIAIRALRAAEMMGGGGGMMGGSRKAMLGRLGIGIAGTAAAQIGGNAVGGDAGNWISSAGTGAAIGAQAGPLGALAGGAAGGVLAAVSKIKGEMNKLDGEQLRIVASSRDVATAWKNQRQAAAGLVAADERVHAAHRKARTSTSAMRQAQRHLTAVVAEYGAKSGPAVHAEARLTGLVNKHRVAIKRLQSAERLRGVALSAYKTATNVTILAERHRINVLTQLRDRQARLFTAAKQANPQSEKTRELSARLLGTEGRLSDVTKKHAQTLSDAASKGGASYARFLSKASEESVRAGGQMKALNTRVESLTSNLKILAETEVRVPNLGGHGLHPTHKRPPGNAAGTNFWPGGPSIVGERGPELWDLPRGSRITPAPATRRLLGAVADPQGSSRAAALGGTGGSGTRWMMPFTVKVGRRELLEILVEGQEDAKARL